MSSKEIARTLGISPHTVDQRLRVAVRNLGVSSRFEAARMMAAKGESDADAAYQPLVYQPSGLGSPFANQHRSPGAGTGRFGPADSESQLELHSGQAAYHSFTESESTRQSWHLPPVWGDGAHDLNLSQRVLMIVLIALGSLLAFGTFLSGLDALSRLI